MKITLTDESLAALKKLQERFKDDTAKIQKRFAPLVNQIVLEAINSFNADQISRLETKVIPPSKEKKELIELFERHLKQHGKDAFLKLNQRLNRDTQSNNNSQNSA